MTTDLKRPVVRRTTRPDTRRKLIVSLEPGDILSIREERCRTTYSEPLSAVFAWMARREADRIAHRNQQA